MQIIGKGGYRDLAQVKERKVTSDPGVIEALGTW